MITRFSLRPIVLAAAALAFALPATQALSSPIDWIMGERIQVGVFLHWPELQGAIFNHALDVRDDIVV